MHLKVKFHTKSRCFFCRFSLQFLPEFLPQFCPNFCLPNFFGGTVSPPPPPASYAYACVKAVKQGREGSVMVWGGITDEVRHEMSSFHQKRTSSPRPCCLSFFFAEHNIERMDPWPAHSPNMNPIKAHGIN